MSGWNDERVELLKKLWDSGLSASQIAARLRGVTRNAVISKLHRLGLSGRATTSRMKSHRPTRIPAAPTPKKVAHSARPRAPFRLSTALFPDADAEPFVPGEELDIPLNERRTIATMTDKDCRWPIGDPQRPEFHFCNRHKVPGLPYCEFHARRAFQPPQPRRRDVQAPVVVKPKQVEEV